MRATWISTMDPSLDRSRVKEMKCWTCWTWSVKRQGVSGFPHRKFLWSLAGSPHLQEVSLVTWEWTLRNTQENVLVKKKQINKNLFFLFVLFSKDYPSSPTWTLDFWARVFSAVFTHLEPTIDFFPLVSGFYPPWAHDPFFILVSGFPSQTTWLPVTHEPTILFSPLVSGFPHRKWYDVIDLLSTNQEPAFSPYEPNVLLIFETLSNFTQLQVTQLIEVVEQKIFSNLGILSPELLKCFIFPLVYSLTISSVLVFNVTHWS